MSFSTAAAAFHLGVAAALSAPPLGRRPGSRGHSAIPAATPGRSHRRRPRRSAIPVAEDQLEQQVRVGLSGDGHLEFPAVGEVEPSRPGGCSWGKYTSRSGPCSARQSCNRRCSVLSWEALNRPGCCSANQSIIVVALSLPSDHSVAAARSHPPTPRRRDRAECATSAPVSSPTEWTTLPLAR